MTNEEIVTQVQQDLIDPRMLKGEFERRDGGYGTVFSKHHSSCAAAFAQALGLQIPEHQQPPEPSVCPCGVCDPCTERIGSGFTT